MTALLFRFSGVHAATTYLMGSLCLKQVASMLMLQPSRLALSNLANAPHQPLTARLLPAQRV
jgi:hypothetical protein